MKIIFLLPDIKIFGGVRATFELANELVDRRHDVFIVYPLLPGRCGCGKLNFKKMLGRIWRLFKNLLSRNRVKWFELKAKLLRVPFLSEKFLPDADVIVATWWEHAFFVDELKNAKIKKVYLIRHYEAWGGPVDLVDKTYKLDLNRIVISGWLKTLIEEKFKVKVIGPVHDGVNLEAFYRKKTDRFPSANKRIGIMYRKSRWKGMQEGLLVFLNIQKEYQNIDFVLFGEDILPIDRVLAGKIKNLKFIKLPYKEQLRGIYNSLDIFVFPSLHEGFGLPPMEAMACGAAVVSTDVGAVKEFSIHGKTALISPPGVVKSLTENVRYLLKNEDARRKMAEEGCKHIQQFSWGKTTKELEDIFKSIS